MRDDWDMTDSLIRALGLMKYAPVEKREDAPRGKRGRKRLERIEYVPTLPGVHYDRHRNCLRSRVKVVIDGKKRDVQVGQGRVNRAEEERLHAAWLAKKQELGLC